MIKTPILKIKVIFISTLLKIFYGLNKKNVRGRNHYLKALAKNQSVIFSVWHGQLLSILYDLRKENITAVAGTHKDAELISVVAKGWGWKMIRGSSKEKGNVAYKGMIKTLKKPGSMLFITPDGPTGPRHIPKFGIIRAAQSTNSIVIPISVYSTKNWKFKNWDTFYLEKPFGKIFIEYGKPIIFDRQEKPYISIENLKNAMGEVEKNNLHYANK
ncbi:MAG: lysophospholipid acyltransferase family protein [Candidatus Neomarinimicrobiota bacterium]